MLRVLRDFDCSNGQMDRPGTDRGRTACRLVQCTTVHQRAIKSPIMVSSQKTEAALAISSAIPSVTVPRLLGSFSRGRVP